MAGGVPSEDEILLQVQGLVSDSLAVVSYKWLSRKFSLPSNAAKRVLQKFADLVENSDLEVVYAVCGWSKQEPQSYVIQLVPKLKLEEVKSSLKDLPSIHVYSVQRSIPKDPAQLWSTDFVQAEELFNESSESNNCLRDNRFSAVTCELIRRLPTRQTSGVASPPPPRLPVSNVAEKVSASTILAAKAPAQTTPVPPLPAKNSEAAPKDVSGGRKPPKSSIPPATPQTDAKESSGAGSAGKRKAPVAKGGSGNASSLASMWGKAPAKPKAASPPVAPPTAALAGDAEARIQALEEEEESEDDMVGEFTAMRRGQGVTGGVRRRRMIVDDADDEDDVEGAETETVIRLGSPEAPDKGRPAVAAATRDSRTSREQEKSPSLVSSKISDQGKAVKSEPILVPDLPPKVEVNGEHTLEVKANATMPAPGVQRVGGSKRKKVLKTLTDDRGIEVSEVVWEKEGEEKENIDKDKEQAVKQSPPSTKQVDTKPPIGKPPAVQKPSTAPVKSTANKGGRPSAKSAAKPVKGQGNIMSFFKKT